MSYNVHGPTADRKSYGMGSGVTKPINIRHLVLTVTHTHTHTQAHTHTHTHRAIPTCHTIATTRTYTHACHTHIYNTQPHTYTQTHTFSSPCTIYYYILSVSFLCVDR